jgi:hypothetical protein
VIGVDRCGGMSFLEHGWNLIAPCPELSAWINHAKTIAPRVLADPTQARWYRHGRTWFAGVNALPNDDKGAVDGGPPLEGASLEFIRSTFGLASISFDRGQLSVCFPGYPKPSPDESEVAFQYRLRRDAAHVDGLHGEGAPKRRFLREPHAFIWGIPLTDVDESTSPLVVWEGSHQVMRQALATALADLPSEAWPNTDLTDAYHGARRRVFDTCRRIVISTHLGQSYLIHRLALHGMAPWASESDAHVEGRPVVYFRPLLASLHDWLTAP